MTKLNQIIAVEKGVKSRVHSEISDVYKAVQKSDLFNGFAKQYQKASDDGEDLPAESRKVQLTAKSAINATANLLSDLFDVTAVKDWTNCTAKANVTVDGNTLLGNVPVSYLLFLEKQLTDVRTFVATLPTLDEAETWNYDNATGLHRTGEIKTHRQKKVQRPLVLYPATDKHPAQTQLITEDILAGYWVSTRQSGAIAKPEKDALLVKVEKLLRAVKEAREQANGVEVVEVPNVSEAVFSFLFGGTKSA